MARPTGKYLLKGTRGDDDISVGNSGATINGTFKALTADQIDFGLIIDGSAGNDRIAGGRGPDELKGGDGNDTFFGSIRYDKFDGGRGVDTIDLRDSATAVGVDLQGSLFPNISVTEVDGFLKVILGADGSGAISNVEILWGSRFNDFIIGNMGANELHGGAGDDAIGAIGGVGVDKLFGDDGNDELGAKSGNNELTGGAGADKFIFEPDWEDGDWIVHDFTPGVDKAYALGFSTLSWNWNLVSYNGTSSLRADFADGDSITFVGITNLADVTLIHTTGWPPM